MFSEKLDIQLLESLQENGLTESTGLQHLCIPKIKSGRDLICIAGDGTGKSTTIVICVLQKLKAMLDDNARAIVIVRDAESAQILQSEFERIGAYTDLRVQTACEDGKLNDQKDEIYMGSDVVIGTAKRLNQIYTLYALNLTMVKILAIDDAEVVIKSINHSLTDRIAESLPKSQKIIFSTAMNDWIARFADEYMNIQEFIEYEDDKDKNP
jgi:ATP-dependent RNA helicase RhlE